MGKELDELGTKGKLLGADGCSYARLYLHKSREGEEILRIETWLHSSGNELIGRLEQLSLVYQDFLCCVEESALAGGKTCRRLSLPECHRPAIEFNSRRNLKKVAQRKGMRRKLGKFLDRHFRWPDAVKIQIVDDRCVPYSFFFREERINGNGICGGILLHGQEDLKKACYGIHRWKNLIDSPAGLGYNKCEVICLLQSAVRFSHRGTKGGMTDG